ncbi:SPOR domain-containing protein [Capnocytophaga sp. ARDL2]|uniref:SPOR domain-containing protein n=1 Tax=Capnocytophaga sp. ARDL2 TaxID=3238809 RepID=UPI0035580C26
MKDYLKLVPFVFLTFSTLTFAQETSISKPNQLDLLISKKFKTNNSFSIYPNFSIQIASSEKDEAEKNYKNFSKVYPNEEATIIYNQPHYKVVVGNFRNKIEAVSFLYTLKKEYPNAFVVKLKK